MVASHNGKRVQAAGQPSAGDFPFIDHFKNGQGWSGTPNWVDPAQLDANGWPTTMGTVTSLVSKMYVPSRVQRPGNYIVDWVGQGTILIQGTVTVTGSLTAANGSVTVSLNADNVNTFNVGMSAITTPFTSIRVYHQDDSAIVDTQVFSQKFLDYIGNFGVLRFMDLMGGVSGQNNVALWSHRKAKTSAIWSAPEARASLSVTATYALNGSSNDYSATYGSGGPSHGEMVMFKVPTTATNTTVTFNKNSTGALPVLGKDGGALTTARKPDSGAGKIATFVFNSSLNSWIAFGGGTTDGSLYLMNGWPVEVCLDLCKAVGAHPWFVIPFVALDPVPGADSYPGGLATLIKTGYQDVDCPWMVPRFEHDNECWNFQFTQTFFGDNIQKVRNGFSLGVLNAVSPGLVYPGAGGAGTANIKATGASAIPLYAYLFMSSFGGVTGGTFSGGGGAGYVIQKNVGGDADTICVNISPATGSWTSGGTVQGQAGDHDNWYGRGASQLGQAVAAVYGFSKSQVKTQTKYQIICGVKTGATPSTSNDRLAATGYVLSGGDPASDWVTTIACAQYIAPADRGYASELTKAWKYSQGDLTQATSFVDTLPNTATNNSATLPAAQANYTAWKTWAKGSGLPWAANPINRMCGYEGDYSPDYLTSSATVTGTISGATIDATGCTISFSAGLIESTSFANPNGPFEAGTVVAGLTFTIAGVAGMTQLNGLTATIVSVSGNQVKTNIDSSTFSAYTSGGTATVVNGRALINNLRHAGKSAKRLAFHTQTNLNNFVNLTDATFTAEFPSFFLWSGSSYGADLSTVGAVGDHGGQVWPVQDPDIYAADSPQLEMIKLFNARKRRIQW